ncbi:MAG: TolC family protein [Saprospiraceae bacterium]|nr:TolC family protein [Saprospiraceae bacterium]
MIKWLSFLFILTISFPVEAQQEFSLDQAIEYAINNSNNIKLAQLDVADADAQIIEYRSIGLPQVEAGLNYQYYFQVPVNPVEDFITPSIYNVLAQEFEEIDPFTGTPQTFEFALFRPNNLFASVDFRWLLLDGSYFSGLKAAKLFKELTRKGIDVKEEEIRANVTKAYMNILIAEESKKIIQNNLKILEKTLEDTRAFYENGFMEKLDVERLELSMGILQTDFEKIDQAIALSYNLLKFQMSYPINEEIQVTEDLETLVNLMSIEKIDLEERVDYNNKAQYSEILLGKELNKLNVQRLKRGYLPSLQAKANYSESIQRENLFDGNELGWIPQGYVSLGITLPIFDGLMKKGQVQQAKIELDKIDVQKSEFERAIDLQVANAKLQYINARKTLQNRRSSLEIVQSIYDKTIIKFNEGVGSSVEVTQAEQQLYEAQGNYVNALYELLVTKTDLEIALGNI